jgi:hypothetical protein
MRLRAASASKLLHTWLELSQIATNAGLHKVRVNGAAGCPEITSAAILIASQLPV